MSTLKDRLQWSIDMQEAHALKRYYEQWDVNQITEVDKEGEDNEGFKHLDYSGIDKIVHTESGTIHVAQRFRRMRNTDSGLQKPDFSIRYKTYNEERTEYQKLRDNYYGVGNTPGVYGFGITPYGRRVALADGFKEFYLIDMDKFLRLHFDDGVLVEIGKIPNGDGSTGIYFDLDDVEKHGCVIRKWSRTTKPSNKENILNWVDD